MEYTKLTASRKTTTGGLPDSPDRISVVVARDNIKIETLREIWGHLNWHPNAQIDFFKLINAERKIVRPHVIVVLEDGVPSAMVIGRIVDDDVRARLGYKTFRLARLRQLHIIYGGLLGNIDEHADLVVGGILRVLRDREAEMVLFNHLDTRLPVFESIRRNTSRLCRAPAFEKPTHWRVQLPETIDKFIQRSSKKHRYWLRRSQRVLQKDYSKGVTWRSADSYASTTQLADAMETVAAETYQRKLGGGFEKNVENLHRLELAARNNWLRAIVMEIDNKPCAYWLGSVYRDIYYSEATGYDTKLRKYEIGTLAFFKLVESLCLEGVKTFDFGLGDALYKQRLGDASWEEDSIRIFAPSARGITVNLMRTVLEGPTSLGRSILQSFNAEHRIKTFWRRRLSPRKQK